MGIVKQKILISKFYFHLSLSMSITHWTEHKNGLLSQHNWQRSIGKLFVGLSSVIIIIVGEFVQSLQSLWQAFVFITRWQDIPASAQTGQLFNVTLHKRSKNKTICTIQYQIILIMCSCIRTVSPNQSITRKAKNTVQLQARANNKTKPQDKTLMIFSK